MDVQLIRAAMLSHRIVLCGDCFQTLLLGPISQGCTHTRPLLELGANICAWK